MKRLMLIFGLMIAMGTSLIEARSCCATCNLVGTLDKDLYKPCENICTEAKGGKYACYDECDDKLPDEPENGWCRGICDCENK